MVGAMSIKPEHKVIFTTVIAVIVIWIFDAAYDAFVDHEGDFVTLLTHVNEHEPFLRLFMTAGFLVFGFIVAYILSKHRLTQEMLKTESAAIEASMDGIAIYDQEGKYVYVNRAYASINGYAKSDEIIGKSYAVAYEESERLRMEQVCFPALKKSGQWRGELVARRKNGSAYFQEASVTMLEDGGRVCIVRDITWRKKHEERLRRSEHFLNTIFDSIRDPFCIFDRNLRIIRVNDAYARLKNRTADEMIGQYCHSVLANRDIMCEECVVGKTLKSGDPCAKDKLVLQPDGTQIWVEIFTYPILDEQGVVSHVVEYTRDVTDRKRSEEEKLGLIEKLEYLSRTDGLTGLMNRRALEECLTYELDRAKRYGKDLSLVLFDIDNFKAINDTYGHDAGDRALQNISMLLKSILRKSDLAGRYGGDEFMLILPETSPGGAENLAEKFLIMLRESSFQFDSRTNAPLSISIGVAAPFPNDVHIDHLIKRADDAMYESKKAGRDRVTIKTP